MQKDGKFINSIKTGHLEAAVFCAALRCLKCKKNINKKKEKTNVVMKYLSRDVQLIIP